MIRLRAPHRSTNPRKPKLRHNHARRAFAPAVRHALENRVLTTTGLGHAFAFGAPSTAEREQMVDQAGLGAGGHAFLNLTYTDRAGQPQSLDLHTPSGTPPPGGWPVVLALPGGGWRWVRRQDLEGRADLLTQYGFAVATASYAFGSSQIGTKIWPLDLADVEDAVRWLRTHADRYSLNPNQIAAMGESAGGHLAALLGTAPNEPPGANPLPDVSAADQALSRVQAVVDSYGPTNLPELFNQDVKDQPYMETFLGGTPTDVPGSYQAASPALQVAPNDPPFLILQGTADTAVPYTQSVELSTALTQAGVANRLILLNGVGHGFALSGPHRNNLPDVANFLREAFAGQPITG
jgi:acetyl esterase/lipase